jgi:cytochrome c
MAYAGRGRLALAALFAVATPTLASAQAATGDAPFRQRCALCHSVVAGKISPLAPNLVGVVGRKAGTTAFAYSTAMKASNIVWTRANLDKYLAAPAKAVAGTKMAIAVTDAKQRGLIIDYLATVK